MNQVVPLLDFFFIDNDQCYPCTFYLLELQFYNKQGENYERTIFTRRQRIFHRKRHICQRSADRQMRSRQLRDPLHRPQRRHPAAGEPVIQNSGRGKEEYQKEYGSEQAAMKEGTEITLEQQVALLYEQIHDLEERLNKIEKAGFPSVLKVPQYLICESEPDDPHKECMIEFPARGNASFIINFVKGNNIPDDAETTLELMYYEDATEDLAVPNTYACNELRTLPKKLNPGAHALIECWIDDEKDPNDITADDFNERYLECVAMTSLGTPAKRG